MASSPRDLQLGLAARAELGAGGGGPWHQNAKKTGIVSETSRLACIQWCTTIDRENVRRRDVESRGNRFYFQRPGSTDNGSGKAYFAPADMTDIRYCCTSGCPPMPAMSAAFWHMQFT